MQRIIPPKLQIGDTIRVVAPAHSLGMSFLDNEEMRQTARERFSELGLILTFGKNVYEINDVNSSSINSRIEDIHEAFVDPEVKIILAVSGGDTTLELLESLDFELIKNNPKIVCGFSDISILLNVIFERTGLVTYHGPIYYMFGDILGFDYTLEYFKKCLFSNATFEISASDNYSDDLWIGNQQNREFFENSGHWVVNEGTAEGIVLGGNLFTINLLQNSKYMPDLSGAILLLEDVNVTLDDFKSNLLRIVQLPSFNKVKGLVIGRFSTIPEIKKEKLIEMLKSINKLENLPIIANVDFGHTRPVITFPVGGTVRITAQKNDAQIEVILH
jgi:muramoyltetrapeptide carboxypeptidase LdcA involved in peptidoglycan recycling